MNALCGKCGVQTREGAKFCHGCGAPVAAEGLPPTVQFASGNTEGQAPRVTTAEPPRPMQTETFNRPSAPTAYNPQMPQTYNTGMPMAPEVRQKKSNGALKAILITLVLLVLIGGASGVAAIFFISRAVPHFPGKVQGIPGIPDLSAETGDAALSKLGLPVYPDAKPAFPAIAGDMVGEGESASGGFALFTTEDDIMDVIGFYKENLPQDVKINDVTADKKRTVDFTVTSPDGEKHVVITRDESKEDGQTSIALAAGTSKSGGKAQSIADKKMEESIRNLEEKMKQAEKDGKAAEAQAMKAARDALQQAEKARKNIPVPPPPPAPAARP